MAAKTSIPLETLSPSGERTRLLKDEDGAPLLRYSLSPLDLPDLPKRSGRRIRHYHEAVENQWRVYWETAGFQFAKKRRAQCEAEGAHFAPLSMTLSLSVPFASDALLCVRQDVAEDTGDHHPSRILHAVTWDVRSGAPLPLSAFFPHNRHWKHMLLDALRAEARKMEDSGLYLLDDNAEENFVRHFSADHYLLFPDGLAIYYPHCTVAHHVEGILVVPLPFPVFDPCNHSENHV